MIYVIATVELNQNCREKFLEAFHRNIPKVKAEKGCAMYQPTIDVASGIPIQPPVRPDVVTIVEGWESLDALKAHAVAPHMKTYREETKGLVKGLTLQVLQSA